VDDETRDLVELLRHSRSLALLRMIDDARLDQPVDVEQDPENVVEPYRWLVARVGDGVRLTQAGYLPPSLVTEAMTSLGWERDWIGKHNREDQTLPVLELRESAQRLGLLRKNRGHLLVTRLGRRLLQDPEGLWWHLAARLPDARSEPDRHAGLIYLLSVAAGWPRANALLAEGMTVLGWAERDSRQPLSATSAFAAARDTWDMFRRLGLFPTKERWDAPELPPSAAATRLARAALLGRPGSTTPMSNPEVARRGTERAVELMVTLRHTHLPIWRRLIVPASLTLHELHNVIQTAMGWEGYHLHLFDIDGVLYGDVEEIEGRPLGAEDSFTVGQAADAAREFSYEYDFGDSWDHIIRVEQSMASVGSGTPHLIGGGRACPPEDCGGTSGYEHLLEVIADPTHEEHEQLLQWVGGEYDPEGFDLAETNAKLELIDRHTRQRRSER
jgi:hypothetical protein